MEDFNKFLAAIRDCIFDDLTISILLDISEEMQILPEKEALRLRKDYQEFLRCSHYWANPETEVDRKKRSRWELVAAWRKWIWGKIRKAYGKRWKTPTLHKFNESRVLEHRKKQAKAREEWAK